MTTDEVRSGFLRFGYDVNDTLVAKVIELVEHDPHNLTDDGPGFEIWRPDNWLALNDALHGWDTMSGFGTERDGPYIGPPGVAIGGNAAEDLLCFHASGGTLIPKLFKWNQIGGCFEPI